MHFVEPAGSKRELICFNRMTDYILRELEEQGSNTKMSVIRAAAKIIRKEFWK